MDRAHKQNNCFSDENMADKAKRAFTDGEVDKALALFTEAERQNPKDAFCLFYISWISYIVCEKRSEQGGETYKPFLRRAFDIYGADGIAVVFEEELGGYLDMAAHIYGMNHAFSDIDDIISPRNVDIIRIFQFAEIASQEFPIQYGDGFSRKINGWIDALTLRLFRQAEFSGIRLKLPVELITKKDIENADILFGWLDDLYDAIVVVDSKCGEKFFELQIGFRLDLVEKCLPRLKDVCGDYMYFFPSLLSEAEIKMERAKLYACVILSICYSLGSYNISMKKRFVEAAPLLKRLRIVHARSYGSMDAPENPWDEDIYYELPEDEYREYITKAQRLIKEIMREEKDYDPPAFYEIFAV